MISVVQIGSHRGFDDLSNHLTSNYSEIKFGLFVEANPVHIPELTKCYECYDNAIIRNVAVKLPNYTEDILTIYYDTNDPQCQVSSCDINHVLKHQHCWPGGEIKSFEISAITLEDLFDFYEIKELDWLLLDVEGIDAELIKTFDWSKYKIKRVEFEHIHLGKDSPEICQMFFDMGYKQVSSLHEYDWAFEINEERKIKELPLGNQLKESISVMFFGRTDRYKSGGSSTEMVEYDFILNELLPKDRDRFIRFIPYTDLEDITNVDVFVYRCRSRTFCWDSNPNNYPWGFIPTFNEVLTAVDKLKPKIIIQLSDEYIQENNDEHNQLANKCNLFLRQHRHLNHHWTSNTLQLPLRDGSTIDPEKIKPIAEREYNWMFVGAMKNDREEMINSFNSIPKGFFATEGIAKNTVIDLSANSIFVPCGRGNSSLECFRNYEATMCGAIPVLVATNEEIQNFFTYDEMPPWIVAESWERAVDICVGLLSNPEELQQKQNANIKWWEFTLKNIKEKIRVNLSKEKDPIKVVQIGSNNGNDKLSKYLLDNYQSLEFGLFVEPNKLHIKKLKKCYRKYSNAIIENIAVKLPEDQNENLTIYYHIDDAPDYEIASTKIEHILWHTHLPNRENNYEGKIESFSVPALTIEELFDKHKIVDLDWLLIDVEGLDADLILTFNWKKYNIRKVEFEFLHLGYKAEAIKNMFLDMGYTQVNSLNPTDDWAFVNQGEYQKINKKNIDKLQNFPPVHFISTIDSEQRRNLLYKKFAEYNITNVTPHIFKRYEDGDYVFHGEYIDKMIGAGRGPLTSHLRTIKEWYLNTDEPYAFFCEDDLSFETVQYWNFTWEEFFESLPKDWECVQLCWVREEYYRFLIEFRHRCWCDWSGCAYLISREYARKVVENYHYDDEFHLDIKGEDVEFRPEGFKIPVIETVIFSSVGKVYGMPLFVEDVNNCLTTWRWGSGNEVNYWSYLNTIDWWNRIGQYLTLDDHFKSLRDKI